MELLLKCNARVDVFDNEGRSALHLAALAQSPETLELLLSKGDTLSEMVSSGDNLVIIRS